MQSHENHLQIKALKNKNLVRDYENHLPKLQGGIRYARARLYVRVLRQSFA
jgi:hypothetical protein